VQASAGRSGGEKTGLRIYHALFAPADGGTK